MSQEHCTVLLSEAIDALQPKADGVYVDGTYGRGGHTGLLLSKLGEKGRVIVFDRDPIAIRHAMALASRDKRVTVVHAAFADLQSGLASLSISQVDGVLLDLGVSSPQLDVAERGFSFRHDGPLDMRMDPTKGEPVSAWLARATVDEISEVIKNYGEERFAFKIAKTIVDRRATRAILRTHELASLVAGCVKREPGKDPATRTFQALRIYINQELAQLEAGLVAGVQSLSIGGRLVVISFHSLEDRIVKQFMNRFGKLDPVPRGLAIRECERETPILELCGRVKPNEEEVANNPRARSAVMRVACKRKNWSFN